MQRIRTRCHFSVIFEKVWQFWLIIAFMLLNELDVIIEAIRKMGSAGLAGFYASTGFWVLVGLLAVTLALFLFQFFRWRKTWITLEENLVIFERNTLQKIKNTVAIENISAVNMERNLFERLVGTYKIKLDTSSMTTANETDISIILSEKKAIHFRRELIERIGRIKAQKAGAAGAAERPAEAADASNTAADRSDTTTGVRDAAAVGKEAGGSTFLSEERQPDQLTRAAAQGRNVYRYTPADVARYALYNLPMLSLLTVVLCTGGAALYIAAAGFGGFVREMIGGYIALALLLVGSLYNLVKRFFTYYDFSVYRDGGDLHIRCGLLKLRSYTVPVDKITALNVEQPLMSRIFRKYSLRVITVGIGDDEDEAANLTLSLSGEALSAQIKALLPEYGWCAELGVDPEERTGVTTRVIKAVSWQVALALAAALLTAFSEIPLWAVLSGAAAFDAVMIALCVLSHRAAGYRLHDAGLVTRDGYVGRHYRIFSYGKAQVFVAVRGVTARRQGTLRGNVMLLNSTAQVPYIKEETACNISDRIIRGKK